MRKQREYDLLKILAQHHTYGRYKSARVWDGQPVGVICWEVPNTACKVLRDYSFCWNNLQALEIMPLVVHCQLLHNTFLEQDQHKWAMLRLVQDITGYESGAPKTRSYSLFQKDLFPTCIKHTSESVTATLKISLQPFIPLNIPPVWQKTKLCEYKQKVKFYHS